MTRLQRLEKALRDDLDGKGAAEFGSSNMQTSDVVWALSQLSRYRTVLVANKDLLSCDFKYWDDTNLELE